MNWIGKSSMRIFQTLLYVGILTTVFSAASLAAAAETARTDAPPQTKSLQRSLLIQMQDAFTEIARTVEPTVVNIKALRSEASQEAIKDGISSPGPFGNSKIPILPRRSEATGSGVIVRSDGYILTNEHVIDHAIGGLVTVTLSDGREFQGKVYPDYKSDLAIVKIDPGTVMLPVAQFADAGTVNPGQWALAVGSPFDLQNTITVGIISAINRHQRISGDGEERYYPDLIQTDAAINPGNSGGPLFNIDGKVVGINVAIESPVEGSAGVGFAIPIMLAQQVATALITHGKVVRGYLGLTPEDLTPALQAQYGGAEGAFVRDVLLSGPAGRSGLQAADIVTEYDGRPIHNELDMRAAISNSVPGKKATISYMRNGKLGTAIATIEAVPGLIGDAPFTLTSPSTIHERLGIVVRTMTERDRQVLSLPQQTEGVIAVSVTSGSLAEASGLAVGMVIEKVNQTPITSKEGFDQATSTLTQSPLTLIVLNTNPADNQTYQQALTLHL